MKILKNSHENYILCTACKADNNKQVIFHMTTYEYHMQPYNTYDAVNKGFKIAREYLQIKRLYETTPVSKEHALNSGLDIIEIENQLPKNVKKMKGITKGY